MISTAYQDKSPNYEQASPWFLHGAKHRKGGVIVPKLCILNNNNNIGEKSRCCNHVPSGSFEDCMDNDGEDGFYPHLLSHLGLIGQDLTGRYYSL